MIWTYRSLNTGLRPELDLWLLDGKYEIVQRLQVLGFENRPEHPVTHPLATDAVSLAASEFNLAASCMSLAACCISLAASNIASCGVLGVA